MWQNLVTSRMGMIACLIVSMMLVASPYGVASAPDEAMKSRVAADKAAVDQALQNVNAAFNNFVATQEAGLKDAIAKGKQLTPAQNILANEPDYKTKRLSVFSANLEKIKQLNEKSGEFLAHGINEFTALTEKEFADLYLTTFPSTTNQPGNSGRKLQQTTTCSSEISYPSTYSSVTSPPSKMDWKASGHVTPVRNQGRCGSCAAFSAIGVAEASYIASTAGATNSNTDLSELDVMACIGGNQCNGAWPDWYLDRMTCKGVLTESQKPYKAQDDNKCLTLTRTNIGATKWTRVPGNTAGYKQALTKGPVSIAIQGNPLQYYSSGVFSCNYDSSSVNHAVTMVAYEDNVAMTNGQTWSIANIKNSWGASWGQSGYVEVRLDCPARGSLAIFDYGVALVK